jgi:hypothetical protein
MFMVPVTLKSQWHELSSVQVLKCVDVLRLMIVKAMLMIQLQYHFQRLVDDRQHIAMDMETMPWSPFASHLHFDESSMIHCALPNRYQSGDPTDTKDRQPNNNGT